MDEHCFYTIFALLMFGTTFGCLVFGGIGLWNAYVSHRNKKGTI